MAGRRQLGGGFFRERLWFLRAPSLRPTTLPGGCSNNFGTTTRGGMVISQLKATVFQFPDISGLEMEIEGERWCGWEGPPCTEVPIPMPGRP